MSSIPQPTCADIDRWSRASDQTLHDSASRVRSTDRADERTPPRTPDGVRLFFETVSYVAKRNIFMPKCSEISMHFIHFSIFWTYLSGSISVQNHLTYYITQLSKLGINHSIGKLTQLHRRVFCRFFSIIFCART